MSTSPRRTPWVGAWPLALALCIVPGTCPGAEPAAHDSTEFLEASEAARVPGLRGRPDLLQHASLAFAIGLGVGMLTEEPGTAAGVSISLGVVKEFSDPHFDRGDLLADLVGAGLAAWATYLLSR